MTKQACEAAITGPAVDVLAHAKVPGTRCTVSGTCVGIETREA